MKQIQLSVMEAISDDINKGLVRINSPFMEKLDVKEGDIIGIQGYRETFAVVGMGYTGDVGMDIVRMDGVTRRNADVGIGEQVKIFKAELSIANKIIVRPADPDIIISIDTNHINKGLDGRPLSKGDIFTIGGISKPSKILESPIFSDVFKILDADLFSLGLSDIKFKVLQTYPKTPCIVFFNTEFILKKGAKEITKSRIVEYTEGYIKPFERKVNSIDDVEELEKLRNKVNSIKVRISPKVTRTLDTHKHRLMRQIDNKIKKLEKSRKIQIES